MRALAVRIAALLALQPVPLPAADQAAERDQAEMVRWLVAHQDDLRDIPFAEVVRAATGKEIIPVDPKRDAALLKTLAGVLDATLAALNDPTHPIHGTARINEASRFIEDEIRRQVNLLPGWECAVPLTAEGNAQRAGYPDLHVVTDNGAVLYLDPKLYEAGSRDSSLRTFYYEPRSLTGKIHDDARQMLVGVEHSGKDPATMRLTSWDLIDVSKLRVQLKAEFQAGNRDIYRDDMVVGSSHK